jgi:hypothetical protein
MGDKYIILNYRRSMCEGFLMFWNPNSHGYTNCLGKAGIFSEKQIERMQFDYKKSKPFKLSDTPNELGITLKDIALAQHFRKSEIRVVLWNESDLNGRRLIEVVSKYFKEE